jgi:hypothetical protein
LNSKYLFKLERNYTQMSSIPVVTPTIPPVEAAVEEIAVLSIRTDENENPVQVLSIGAGSAEVSQKPMFPAGQIEKWERDSQRMFHDAKATFDLAEPLFSGGNFFARIRLYTEQFGWAVLDRQACDGIVSHTVGDVLSFGSGLGAYEAGMRPMLARNERRIVCTDIADQQRPFMPVEKLSSVDAVRKYGEDFKTCVMIWPEFEKPHTVRALKARREPFPYLVYIGEGHGGCTGDDALHEYFEEKYSLLKEINIPTWGGCMATHDWVQIFKRKE